MRSYKYYIFCISIIELLIHFTTIQSSYYNQGRKYDYNKRSQNFFFNFDLQKYVDEYLKHETEIIVKSNESLAENKIKNEIEQVLLKYKHGSNIYKHGKSKTNKSHKWVLNLSQRLDLRSSKKYIALSKFIYLLHLGKYKKIL